jgi:hypothetical protein
VLFHADYGIHPFSFNDNSIELGRNINKQDVDSTLRQNIMLASQQPSLVTPKCWKKLVVLDLFQLLLPAKKCLFLPSVFVNFGNHTASDSWWVMHVKWDAVSFCWNIENTKVLFNKFHLRGMNVCMAWGPLVFMPITKSNTSKGKGENEVWWVNFINHG